MLLVFNRTCPDRNIGKEIGQVMMIFRIEHFIRTGEVVITERSKMQLADGNDAFVHIRFGIGIGLMEHSFVSLTGGSRLVGVNTWNDYHLIGDLFTDSAESGNVFKHRLAVIGRTRTDYKEKLIRSAVENGADCFITFRLDLFHTGIGGKFIFYILGNGKLFVKCHLHNSVPLLFVLENKKSAFSLCQKARRMRTVRFADSKIYVISRIDASAASPCCNSNNKTYASS